MSTSLPAVVSFGSTELSIIDRNGTPWLAAADLARALEYSDARKVTHIYQRRAAEFTTEMTGTIEVPSSGTSGLIVKQRIFSPRGAHLVAMFARTTRATEFRRWVLDVLDGLGNAPPALPPPSTLTPAQQRTLQEIVSRRASAYPPHEHGRVFPALWGALKTAFRVGTYKDLPQSEFAAAQAFLELCPLEMPMPIPSDRPRLPRPAPTLRNRRWLISLDSDGREHVSLIPADAHVISIRDLTDLIRMRGGDMDPGVLAQLAQAAMGGIIAGRAPQDTAR